MIKAVSFDIGGTILLNKNNKEDQYNLKKLSHFVAKPYDEVRFAYKEVFQKKKGKFSFLVKSFCQVLNINESDDINNFFHNKFNQEEETIINKEAKEVIKKLKKEGYKIIFFSNSCYLFANNLDKDLLCLADYVFYSYDIGYTKDDKESYKYIEQKTGYKSNEFLHIGDTLKSDYLMPIENGWNALYYGIAEDDIKSIKHLSDIIKYLSKTIF